MRRRSFLSLTAASPLLLAEGHQTNYTICLSRDASLSEQRGARELQRYLGQMCGVRMPIVTDDRMPSGPLLLVGKSAALNRIDDSIPFGRLGAEGFALKTVGPHVIIAGGRQRGTMYGVSAFLEQLGCRWYATDCTVVPKVAALRIPALNMVEKPALEYREVFIAEAQAKDWAAHNRVNGNFSQLDETTGGKFVFYPFVHSFYALLPPEKYFGAHPEYYSLINGARRGERAQLCLSNPEVLRIATERVLGWAAEHPEAAIFSVSQNDNNFPCECANCRRIEEEEGGTHSGPIIRFVNALAAEVARKYPDKLIDTLAYGYSEPPPSKVRPAPNVRVRMALSGACDAHPYTTCPEKKWDKGVIQSWSSITSQLYSWHYMTNFHQSLEPYPNFDELSGDIDFYRRNGVLGLFMQGSNNKGGGGELAELRAYLVAKLLWNPSLDQQATIREFTDGFYGPAGPAMREYIALVHHHVWLPPRGLGQQLYMYAGPDFTPDFIPRSHELFAKMKAATQKPGLEAEARRVRKAELSIDSVEMFNAKQFTIQGRVYGPVNLDQFWNKYAYVTSEARSYGMTSLYENVTMDAMDKEYRRYIRNYETVELRNPSIRLVAAPKFDGHVVGLFNKAGKNTLRITDRQERFTALEVIGGLVLMAHPDYYSRRQYEFEWNIRSHNGEHELELEGVSANGLKLHRVFSLSESEPILHTATTILNAGKGPVPITIQSRVQINPGNRQKPTVEFSFPKRDGSLHREQILPPVADNQGEQSFLGDERPAGEWSLINPSESIKLTNRFADDQVNRCRFWWRGRCRNTVAIGVWSPLTTLAPGESMTFKTDYVAE